MKKYLKENNTKIKISGNLPSWIFGKCESMMARKYTLTLLKH
jgi:hypothetical protein